MQDIDITSPSPKKNYLAIILKVVGILTLTSIIIFIFVMIGMASKFYTLVDHTVTNITASFNLIVLDGNQITFDIHRIQTDITDGLVVFKTLSNDTTNITTIMLQIAEDLDKIAHRID